MSSQEELARVLRELMNEHAFGVERAIEAHLKWRARLAAAVEQGSTEDNPADIARDDRCELGQWLHGMPPEDRTDKAFRVVVQMHARFHNEAAEVVRLLQQGHVEEARVAISATSNYVTVSDSLIELLGLWRDAA